VNTEAMNARLADRREHWVELLERLTNIEGGTEMVDGVAEVGRIVASELDELGFTVELVDGGAFAPHIVAQLDGPGRPIVLGGHLDTTYTDYAPLPAFALDPPRAVGPGTADMRGGVVCFLAALDAMAHAGLLGRCPIAVLFNSDEERGAPTSRDLFREWAGRARAALFGEAGAHDGQVVTGRRAKLSYRLDVAGIAGHAGGRTGTRASALLDLSHRVIAIEGLNERFEDTAVNVGRAWGGVASNTIPAHATALIDIRYPRADQKEPVEEAMSAINEKQHVSQCSATLTLTSFRPAWPENEGSRALAEMVRQIGSLHGEEIATIQGGGTSDANWFGAAGVPALDGLGPIGFGHHTPDEYILLDTLFDRALLVAELVAALADADLPR